MNHTTPWKKIVRGALLAAGCLALLGSAVRSSATGVPVHLTHAVSLVAEIDPADNEYNSNSQVVWPAPGVTSSNQTVCGQFITRLIQQSYGRTDSDFYRCIGSTSPYAKTYHDWFKGSQTCSSKLTHQHIRTVLVPLVADWQAGDLIAIKNLTVETNNTGHMAMVSGAPQLLSEADGVRTYAVPVIDSTQTPHDAADSRITQPDASGKADTGVGEGRMLVLVSASTGKVVGHAWSTDHGSVQYNQSQKSLVAARLVM